MDKKNKNQQFRENLYNEVCLLSREKREEVLKKFREITSSALSEQSQQCPNESQE